MNSKRLGHIHARQSSLFDDVGRFYLCKPRLMQLRHLYIRLNNPASLTGPCWKGEGDNAESTRGGVEMSRLKPFDSCSDEGGDEECVEPRKRVEKGSTALGDEGGAQRSGRARHLWYIRRDTAN